VSILVFIRPLDRKFTESGAVKVRIVCEGDTLSTDRWVTAEIPENLRDI